MPSLQNNSTESLNSAESIHSARGRKFMPPIEETTLPQRIPEPQLPHSTSHARNPRPKFSLKNITTAGSNNQSNERTH